MAFNFKVFWQGLRIKPKTASTADSKGDLEVIDSTGKLGYHNGSTVSPVVTESHTATLTNKTHVSPVINTGVSGTAIDTDGTLATAVDTKVPSALAVKTYVDTSSGSVQADVDDLIELSGVPANSTDLGTFTGNIIPDGSTIKEALQELEAFAETDSGLLSAHIADPTDAHDASAISVVPAGNLTSTDVQAALEELQGDIDTNTSGLAAHIADAVDAHDASAISFDPTGTSLSATEVQEMGVELDLLINNEIDDRINDIATVTAAINLVDDKIDDHIADTVDAHDASAISNVPSGNLAATDVQGALNELQTELDGKVVGPASSTDNAIARYDGTTGKLVQNSAVLVRDDGFIEGLGITNSTSSAGLLVTSDSSVITGDSVNIQGAVFYEVTDDSTTSGSSVVLVPGNVKTIYLSNAGLDSIAGISGTIDGRELILTNGTGSSVTILNNNGGAGTEAIVTGTGADLTLEAAASISLTFNDAVGRWFVVGGSGSGGTVSAGTTDVNILFQQTFEDAVLGDFTQSGLFIDTSSLIHESNCAGLSHQPATSQYFEQTIAVDPKFRGQSVTMSFNIMSTASDGNVVVKIDDVTNTVTLVNNEAVTFSSDITRQTVSFTVPSDCASLSYRFTALQEASFPNTYIDDIVAQISAYSLLETSVDVPVITEWVDYTPTFTGFGTVSSPSFRWRQVGESIEVEGRFTSGTPTATEARISFPNSYSTVSNISTLQLYGYATRGVTATASTYGVLSEPSVSYMTFSLQNASTNGLSKRNGSDIINSSDTFSVFAKFPISGLTATESVTIPLTQSGIIQNPDSMIRVDTQNGYGSTATKIPRFTNVTSSIGSDIAYVDSATNGASFTVQTSGIYDISFDFESGTINQYFGISKNASSLTTNIMSLAQSERLASARTIGTTNYLQSTSFSGYFVAGDVIRPHTEGGTSGGNPTYSKFTVSKQGALSQVNINTNSKITIPTSELRFEGASSRGAVATAIVKFDTMAKIRGDAFTVTNTSNDGTFVTMRKAGKLGISVSLRFPGAFDLVISKNQSVLTSTPTLASEFVARQTSVSASDASCSSEIDVAIGDIIRITSNGTPSANAGNIFTLSFQEQDIQVSVSNTLPQFSQSDSCIRLDGAAGYGSTGTRVIRYSNVRDNIGTDIVYNSSATLGDSFVAQSSGIYNISMTATHNAATGSPAITKNASSLTTDPASLSATEILAIDLAGSGSTNNLSWQGYLNAGDIIRAESNTSAFTGVNSFTISKVGRPNVTGVDVTPFVNVPQPVSQSLAIFNSTTVAASAFVVGPLTEDRGTPGLISWNATTGFFTVLKKGSITISAGLTNNGTGTPQATIFKNTTSVALGISPSGGGGGWGSTASYSGLVEVGDTFSVQNTGGGTSSNTRITLTMTCNSDQILTPIESFSTDTASLTYASSSQYTLSTLANAPVGTFITYTFTSSSTTRVQTTTAPTQTTSDMNINGILITPRAFNTTGSAATPSTIAVQIGKGMKGWQAKAFLSTGRSGNLLNVAYTSGTTEYGTYEGYDPVTGIYTIDAGYATTTNTARHSGLNEITSGTATNSYWVINASKSPALAGVPLLQPRIATISDVKSNGTAGGTATSGSYATRTLNTLDDPTGIVTSLASNQFTLPAGEYYIEANAPGYFASNIKIKLRNITDSTDQIIGSSEYSGNNAVYPQTRSFLSGKVVISSAKTFEIQQRVSLTSAGSGLGVAVSFSDNEVFTIVKVQKVK